MLDGLEWTRSYTPTLKTLEPVGTMIPAPMREAVTKPPAGLTEFEKAQGRPLVFSSEDCTNPFFSSLAAKAALFDAQIGPSTQKPATRAATGPSSRSC